MKKLLVSLGLIGLLVATPSLAAAAPVAQTPRMEQRNHTYYVWDCANMRIKVYGHRPASRYPYEVWIDTIPMTLNQYYDYC